jgi:spore coat protein CotH
MTHSTGHTPRTRRTRRPLRHRLPVRLRLHWRLVAVCLAFLGVCWGVFGSGTVHPYVTTERAADAGVATWNVAGVKDLFDTSVPHDIKLNFTGEAYEDMLTEYFKDGEKKYIEADLTIDGTVLPSVGIRLKGNSTLMGLTWRGRSLARRGPGGGRFPGGADQGGPVRIRRGPAGGGADDTGPGPGPGGPSRVSLKGEEPEDLPWLISFDEFMEGRRYQGHAQVAVRPAAMGSATLLNEALAISLVGAAGEPTQRFAYGSFTVNGRASGPRLIVQYLDEGYAEGLGDGVLYKSLATSTFTYKGEDQTRYVTDFKQINKVGGRDLQPVIDLVRWVNESSDEEFAEGLADRLDVESFARYVVLQNMLLNFDDMAGPGRNYYLWYDLDAKRFTVLNWDLNLAFDGDATKGVNDTMSMGFRRVGAGADRDGPNGQNGRDGREGAEEGGRGGMRMGHPVMDRFLETPAFKRLYQEQYRVLYRKLLAGGTATDLLDGIVRSYKLNDGADTAKVDSEAAALRETLRTRAESLSADAVIKDL